jgi:tRNA(fMet)-specific endonuclease VapC
MYAFDTSFLVDVMRGDPQALAKLSSMEASGETAEVPSPALTETMIGAHLGRAVELRRTLDLVANLQVAETDRTIAMEAGRIGAELLRKGTPMPLPDLLIAATAKVRGLILLSRDSGFARVPGLAVETY